MLSFIVWVITIAMIIRWMVVGGQRLNAWKIDRHASSPATLKQYEDLDVLFVRWTATIILVQFIHTLYLFCK